MSCLINETMVKEHVLHCQLGRISTLSYTKVWCMCVKRIAHEHITKHEDEFKAPLLTGATRKSNSRRFSSSEIRIAFSQKIWTSSIKMSVPRNTIFRGSFSYQTAPRNESRGSFINRTALKNGLPAKVIGIVRLY